MNSKFESQYLFNNTTSIQSNSPKIESQILWHSIVRTSINNKPVKFDSQNSKIADSVSRCFVSFFQECSHSFGSFSFHCLHNNKQRFKISTLFFLFPSYSVFFKLLTIISKLSFTSRYVYISVASINECCTNFVSLSFVHTLYITQAQEQFHCYSTEKNISSPKTPNRNFEFPKNRHQSKKPPFSFLR